MSIGVVQQLFTTSAAKVVSIVIVDKLLISGRVIRPVDVIGEFKSGHGIEILYNKA